jgi:outer membrane lipoprotein-sorting protein
MKEKLVCLALFVVIFISLNFPTLAVDLDANTIISKMKEALEPEISCTRKLVFTIKDDQNKVTNTWVAREGRKKLADGKRTLLVMLEPDEVKGISTLMWEQNDKTDVRWTYLPAMKRFVKFVSSMAFESFQGTDFTYSDIGFINVRGTHKLLGIEEHLGKKAYKVETIPEAKWYYSRIIKWASTENFLPLERDFYDVAGNLWKTEFFEDVAGINNIPTPLKVRMIDVQTKTSTEYRVSDICYGAPVADEVFEPTVLPKALDVPFCPIPPMGSATK